MKLILYEDIDMNAIKDIDVCIIGAGASGMTAALAIAMQNRDIKVMLIEKKSQPGSKIKASGNGRCNISNFRTTTFGDSVKFFRSIGVEIKTTEEGWAYPVSERAEDVVRAFELRLEHYGVEVVKECCAEKILKREKFFEVYSTKMRIQAKKVIIATGGKAGPQYGCTGDGYKMARALGHNPSKLKPALAAVQCENALLKLLKGVRVKGSAGLYIGNHQEMLEFGEIQFTDDGLSGICILNLSRGIEISDELRFKDYHIRLNLLTKYTFIEIFHILTVRSKIENFKTEDLLLSIVNEKISKAILKKWSDKKPVAADLEKVEIEHIVYEFMNISFAVKGVKGWRYAQITSGGITFSEFNYETMESNICKGLYFTGEMIAYDGPCGGYNLENAWNTGRKAAGAICTELAKSK